MHKHTQDLKRRAQRILKLAYDGQGPAAESAREYVLSLMTPAQHEELERMVWQRRHDDFYKAMLVLEGSDQRLLIALIPPELPLSLPSYDSGAACAAEVGTFYYLLDKANQITRATTNITTV